MAAQFARQVARALKLPEAGRRPTGGGGVELGCEGFSLTAFLRPRGEGATLLLTDAAAAETKWRERQDEERKKRESFKP